MSKILKGTTKIDYSTKTNEEIGGEYSKQLYWYLRDDLNEDLSVKMGRYITRNKRDSQKDRIIIDAYERSMQKLGLNPNTEEIIEAAQHDNDAVFYRYVGPKNSLLQIFYSIFKNIKHVLEEKPKYMGCEVDLKEIEEFSSFIDIIPLENKKGEVVGIGKNSICLKDSKGNKRFFWYLSPPLKYDNCGAHGGEIACYLVNKYGE